MQHVRLTDSILQSDFVYLKHTEWNQFIRMEAKY